MAKLRPFLAHNSGHTSGFGSFFFSFPPDSSPEAIKADYFEKNRSFCSIFMPHVRENQSRTIKFAFVSDWRHVLFSAHDACENCWCTLTFTNRRLTQPFLLIKIQTLISKTLDALQIKNIVSLISQWTGFDLTDLTMNWTNTRKGRKEKWEGREGGGKGRAGKGRGKGRAGEGRGKGKGKGKGGGNTSKNFCVFSKGQTKYQTNKRIFKFYFRTIKSIFGRR